MSIKNEWVIHRSWLWSTHLRSTAKPFWVVPRLTSARAFPLSSSEKLYKTWPFKDQPLQGGWLVWWSWQGKRLLGVPICVMCVFEQSCTTQSRRCPWWDAVLPHEWRSGSSLMGFLHAANTCYTFIYPYWSPGASGTVRVMHEPFSQACGVRTGSIMSWPSRAQRNWSGAWKMRSWATDSGLAIALSLSFLSRYSVLWNLNEFWPQATSK